MKSSFDLFWLKTKYNKIYFATEINTAISVQSWKWKYECLWSTFPFTTISFLCSFNIVYKWSHKKNVSFLRICVIFIPFMNANYKCLSKIMSHATNIKCLLGWPNMWFFTTIQIESIHHDMKQKTYQTKIYSTENLSTINKE